MAGVWNRVCVAVAFSAGGVAALGAEGARDPLAEGFRDPPRQYSMVPLWSWNGRLEPDQLRWQIDQMVDKGVYGAFMHARAGIELDSTPYFSDGWWEAVKASVEHAAKVGFSAWIYDEDKWPSGAAGGRTIQANPQRNTRKGLRAVNQRVSGPSKIPLRIPNAQYVAAGRLVGENRLDADSLVNITERNAPTANTVDVTATRGLRVVVVSDWEERRLGTRCRQLGCAVTELSTKQALTIQLDQADVLVSDVGTPGTKLEPEKLLAWIRGGGGYVDFSHSEPVDPLYDIEMVVKEDAADHRWLLPDHPIASVPNRNPDAGYTGQRWSDQWWRGGSDFDTFDHVLADPRWNPPGISILARKEGKGRVVYCGATQACREDGNSVELLQNLLVYASGRDKDARPRRELKVDEKPPWECPAGNWLIVGYVPDTNPGHEANPAVNYMNKDTVRDFMNITHEEYARRVGKYFGTTIPGVFYDEIHNSGVQIVWVEGFAERFRQMKGYDLIPLLPALSMDIGTRTPTVRCDYYDVYTKLYEEAWFEQIAGWCADHKLELTGHTVEELGAYRTQGSYFRTIKHMQIPGTDNEDFRYRYPRTIDPWKPKQLASISHLYGRPRAGVEAMGGAGWSFTLDGARYGFNMLAAYGINFFMPHLFHYAQDRPANVDDWPNSWFFQNPYWKYFKTFADHGSRLSYMLTGGEHVADAAVLYPITNLWAGGGDGSARRTVELLKVGQIECDLVDPDSLVRATIDQKRLTIGSNCYQVLIVPDVKCVRRDTARKIRDFAAAGGAVIVHNRWPTDSMEAGKDDPEIARMREDCVARGIKPCSPLETVALVSKAVERDVIVSGEHVGELRFHHVRRDGREVYWLANDSRERRLWRVSFRAVGLPSCWQPEDGTITPVASFVRQGSRTECDVALDGWQGCFIVLDTRQPPPVGEHRPKDAARSVSVSSQPGTGAKEITLDGPWQFLPVGDVLDDEWRIDVEEAELALPVMRVQWERGGTGLSAGWHEAGFDDSRWRRIKVLDTLHARAGADRYRSRWDARFVSFYDDRSFATKIGGKGLRCRKAISLPVGASGGWLAVICESPFRAVINDKTYTSEGGGQPVRFEVGEVRAGHPVVAIEADNATAILAEGRLTMPGGEVLRLFTDATWEVSLDGKKWGPAWEYVAPPEKPCGEPPYPETCPLPTVVWYRQPLPPGTSTIREPNIEGQWQSWVDGQAIRFAGGRASIPSDGRSRMLVLRAEIGERQHGLIEPVHVGCVPSSQKLGSWTGQALDWYSGRAMYSTGFVLDESQTAKDTRLQLNLGEVCYCAEVWLNGVLVGTRVWPPYRIDITGHVKKGKNRLTVVVANLLANRMHWDIFDDVKGELWNRKWHDGNIMRDAWCLESGLFGPVRIVCVGEGQRD